MLHCVQEIDQDIDPYIVEFIKSTKISISVNFVIHKNNPHLIADFLNKYRDIQFEVNFADQTFAEINEEHHKAYDCLMDKDSIIETVIQLGKFKNYDRYTNFLTRKLIQNDFKYLNPWSYKNHD